MADALRVSVLLKGKEHLSRTFAKDRILIGRESGCDLRLNNSDVSRRHACIERQEACGYLLRDLESANGIFVGTERISLLPIREGGRARIGKFVLAFHLLDVPWEQHEELETPRIDVGQEGTLHGAGDEGEIDVQVSALAATSRTKLGAWLARLRRKGSPGEPSEPPSPPSQPE